MKINYSRNPVLKKVTLINYSNKEYLSSQRKNTKTGLSIGGFHTVISYSPKDIDIDFFNENKNILNEKRGNGYWLWKPYFIKKTLEQLEDGELLFYCDSGSHFLESIQNLVFGVENQDIMPFELQQIESFWTKKDTFVLMDCDKDQFYNTKQRLGGYILLKKTDFTMKFVNEWLSFSKNPRIITDIDNQCGLPNYPQFIEHRHDQSVFSLLTKKYNLKAYRDPSQFGNNFKQLHIASVYPQILLSTRQRDLSLIKKIKKKSKLYIPEAWLIFYRKLKNKA